MRNLARRSEYAPQEVIARGWRMSVLGIMAIALAMPGMARVATAGMIDDFSVTSFPGVMLVAPGNATHHDIGVPGVAGGSREIALQAVSANGIIDSVGLEIAGGVMSYATGPAAQGSLQLSYTGGSLASDLGGAPEVIWVDFLRFDDASSAGLDVTVVVSDGVDSASLTQTVAAPSLSPFSLGFQLAMFSGIASVDVGVLQAISIQFDGGMGQDFQIDGIRSVSIPEPGAFALAGIAGAVIAAWATWSRGRRLSS